jgi:hypothetical protein
MKGVKMINLKGVLLIIILSPIIMNTNNLQNQNLLN